MSYKNMLEDFWNAFNIPFCLYEHNHPTMKRAKSSFTPDPAAYITSSLSSLKDTISFCVTSDFIMAGQIRIPDKDAHLIIGPVAPYRLSYSQAQNLVRLMDLPDSQASELLMALHYTPVVSMGNFRDTLIFLNNLINPNNEDTPVKLTFSKADTQTKSTSLRVQDENINNLELEQHMQKCIELGNTEELAQILDELPSKHMAEARIGSTNINAIRNTAIVSAALSSRAAIRGGMSYENAMLLSDHYITTADKLNSYTEINEMLIRMMLEFTRRVARIRLHDTDSLIVINVYRYVDKHVYERLTVKGIAENLKLSLSYLSHHFKQATGSGLIHYIQGRKIEEACHLLETTDLSILEVSEMLVFSSQPHFQKVFKKITGTTPKRFKTIL